jgi:hypothetical protein
MDINPNQIKVRCIKPNGQVVMLSKTTARDTAFLKKYGIRIEDEAYLNPQSQAFEAIQEAPKRRRMIIAQEPEIVVSQSSETMMEQTPEVPDAEYVGEQDAEEEINQVTEETNQTTKTRKK